MPTGDRVETFNILGTWGKRPGRIVTHLASQDFYVVQSRGDALGQVQARCFKSSFTYQKNATETKIALTSYEVQKPCLEMGGFLSGRRGVETGRKRTGRGVEGRGRCGVGRVRREGRYAGWKA